MIAQLVHGPAALWLAATALALALLALIWALPLTATAVPIHSQDWRDDRDYVCYEVR